MTGKVPTSRDYLDNSPLALKARAAARIPESEIKASLSRRECPACHAPLEERTIDYGYKIGVAVVCSQGCLGAIGLPQSA